jgi:hypothetical protein
VNVVRGCKAAVRHLETKQDGLAKAERLQGLDAVAVTGMHRGPRVLYVQLVVYICAPHGV